ncbi:hypothetical protein ON010_g15841 [Phytophthora cinnamomi]|nr:hypothetical protein ON010_g15841 [Phytophthora cinnamomi]
MIATAGVSVDGGVVSCAAAVAEGRVGPAFVRERPRDAELPADQCRRHVLRGDSVFALRGGEYVAVAACGCVYHARFTRAVPAEAAACAAVHLLRAAAAALLLGDLGDSVHFWGGVTGLKEFEEADPVSYSANTTIKYHLGTLALSSGSVAPVEHIRSFFLYLENKNEFDANTFTELAAKCCCSDRSRVSAAWQTDRVHHHVPHLVVPSRGYPVARIATGCRRAVFLQRSASLYDVMSNVSTRTDLRDIDQHAAYVLHAGREPAWWARKLGPRLGAADPVGKRPPAAEVANGVLRPHERARDFNLTWLHKTWLHRWWSSTEMIERPPSACNGQWQPPGLGTCGPGHLPPNFEVRAADAPASGESRSSNPQLHTHQACGRVALGFNHAGLASASTAAAACNAIALTKQKAAEGAGPALRWIFWLWRQCCSLYPRRRTRCDKLEELARLRLGLKPQDPTVSVAVCILARPSFLRANRRLQRAAHPHSRLLGYLSGIIITIVAVPRPEKIRAAPGRRSDATWRPAALQVRVGAAPQERGAGAGAGAGDGAGDGAGRHRHVPRRGAPRRGSGS